MSVIYKGGYQIKGVVKHGEAPYNEPEGPQSIYLNTYETGQNIGQGLGWYFGRMFTSYVVTSGDVGSVSVDINNGFLAGTVTGDSSNYHYEFAVTGTDSEGSETVYFVYDVVPLHGMEVDYVVDYDSYTAVFSPRWNDGEPLFLISAGGNPGDSPYPVEEQLGVDGEFDRQNDNTYMPRGYTWAGTLASGLSLASSGLVTGSLAAATDTNFGNFPVTVTNTFGDSAILTVNVKVFVLS